MDVREVLYMRGPRLPEIAGPVTVFDTPELHALVQDSMGAMQAQDGVSLATTPA